MSIYTEENKQKAINLIKTANATSKEIEEAIQDFSETFDLMAKGEEVDPLGAMLVISFMEKAGVRS